MRYSGGCHCGKIAFEVNGEISGVIECNCSLCSKRGYLLWFVPRTELSLKTTEADLSAYRFNTGHIAHHFCANCGCAPFAAATGPDGVAMAAINIRCLDGVDPHALDIQQVDGRSR
jgi:hypothetical protein